MPPAESRTAATRDGIKACSREHGGLTVSTLYIAQAKWKRRSFEREGNNKGQPWGAELLICPPDKEKAIEEA